MIRLKKKKKKQHPKRSVDPKRFSRQQISRSNKSAQANSLKDLLQSRIDDLEKQVLSRVNSIEEGKLGMRNETEQRGRVESTLTSLHQRITDLEKGSPT